MLSGGPPIFERGPPQQPIVVRLRSESFQSDPGRGLKVWNSSSKLAPGIDVRGDGGMVVAPPSKRGDGTYRWVNAAPIAEAWPWLLDLVVLHDTKKSNGAAAQGKKKKSNGVTPPLPEAELSAEEAAAAYAVIPNDDADWEEWNEKGMAGWRATAGEGFAGFDAWSQKSSKYNARRTIEKWQAYFGSPPNSTARAR